MCKNNSNYLGIILIFLSFLSFASANTITKYILHENIMTLSMYYSYSKFFSVVLVIVIGYILLGRKLFIIQNKLITFIRCMILVANTFFLSISLKYLPLDIFYSIVFIMPLIASFLGFILLKEKLSIINIIAIIIGFIGILIIINPNLESNYISFIGVTTTLVTATTGALSGIIVRKYLKNENSFALTFYVVLSALLFGIMILFYNGDYSIVKEQISFISSVLVFFGSFFTIMGAILYVKSYQLARVALIAPVQYTQLIWAIIFGYIIFGDIPQKNSMIGSFIIIFATILNSYMTKKRGFQ